MREGQIKKGKEDKGGKCGTCAGFIEIGGKESGKAKRTKEVGKDLRDRERGKCGGAA